MTFNEVAFKDRDLLVGALQDIGCKEIRQGEDLEMGRYYSDQVPQPARLSRKKTPRNITRAQMSGRRSRTRNRDSNERDDLDY